MKKMDYVAPSLEVIEVTVEAGFAASKDLGGETGSWGGFDENTDGWDE